MKKFFGLVLIIALGVGLGIGIASSRLEQRWWTPEAGLDSENTSTAVSDDEPKPKLTIKETTYDFGTVDVKTGGKHDFVLRNTGNAPLKLIDGGTSCRCTTSDFDDKLISPGGSDKITVTWKAAGRVGQYQQTVKILTNDRSQQEVTLTIKGKVSAIAQVAPLDLIFSRVSANDPATGEVHLLCYLDKKFNILGHHWSDKETADNFDVKLQPMTAEELAKWPTAKSGYRAEITVKPGLPQGPFRQILTFDTSLEKATTLELPIEGIVGSEITIAGGNWNPDEGLLTIGDVPRNKGAKRLLYLFVRGPHRKEVTFKSVEIFPKSMKVTLGEPRELNNGAVVQTPLSIEIPPGSPTINCSGTDVSKYGIIVLETTHPQVAKLRIYVRMAIEE